MTPLSDLFADYAAHHRTKGNKMFHRLGIPLIVFTLLGMLARVGLGSVSGVRLDLAMLVILASGIYYIALDWRLGLVMVAVSIVFYVFAARLPLWLNVTLFVLGWIFQFIGHSVYEKQQPAFFRNFVHLLVGPLWILNDAVPVVKLDSNPAAH